MLDILFEEKVDEEGDVVNTLYFNGKQLLQDTTTVSAIQSILSELGYEYEVKYKTL